MYESQINNTHPDPQKTGSLYGMSKVLKQHAKDYEFWTQHIICRGNHVIFTFSRVRSSSRQARLASNCNLPGTDVGRADREADSVNYYGLTPVTASTNA